MVDPFTSNVPTAMRSPIPDARREAHPGRACGLLLLALCLLPAGAGAQVRLDRPSAAFPEDFGSIQTVRELPGGRVLVADPLAKELYLVDMTAGTRRAVGRQGQGPQEYMQPDAVWPLAADSTLLVDLGNGRVVTLAPDLSFGVTLPIALSQPGPGRTLVLALPQGVDRNGRIYTRAMGGGMGGALPDSAAILRINRATRAADTVAFTKLPDRTQVRSGSANNQSVQISNVPLSPEDAWGVAEDGWVAIARAGDYHVEWVRPDGSVVRGPRIPFEAVGVSTREKEDWVAALGRSGGGIGISVESRNGEMTTTFARGGGPGRQEIDGYTWPATKPAFQGGRIPIDPQGRAWVWRHMRSGEPSTYDVFDRTGRRVGTVTLGAGKRVIGFGAGAVYVVSFDEFDLNYLERYALPALG